MEEKGDEREEGVSSRRSDRRSLCEPLSCHNLHRPPALNPRVAAHLYRPMRRAPVIVFRVASLQTSTTAEPHTHTHMGATRGRHRVRGGGPAPSRWSRERCNVGHPLRHHHPSPYRWAQSRGASPRSCPRGGGVLQGALCGPATAPEPHTPNMSWTRM